MESVRLPYKNDIFGNAIYARVSWLKKGSQSPRPIGKTTLLHWPSISFIKTLAALIYHAGGLVVGSSEIVPKTQIDYLCSKGFVVTMPNYRLLPQVTGKDAFEDCDESFNWTTSTLPRIMESEYDVEVDINKVVAMGHSSGGSMALYLGSCKPVRAVTAFCPFLFVADLSTNAHQPTNNPIFGDPSDYIPSEKDWAAIKPIGQQLSEAPFPSRDTQSVPRNKWLRHIFRTGQWALSAMPDGDLAAIDPMTMLSALWPPVMIVHGSEDNVPGRSLELVQRAEKEMKSAGIKEMHLEVVDGEGHVFDHLPGVGTNDLGQRWQAVVKGLDWLASHV